MNPCMTVATALAAAIAVTTAALAAGEPGETVVPIKVLVMVKETATGGPKPFPDVGGFVIRRNRDELKNASCPDSSNEKGELTCRLKCMKDDPDLRLQVVAPLKSQAPIVAGMSPPAAETFSVENCIVKVDPLAKPPPPIRLVYRTVVAMAEELRTTAPEVYAAVVTTTRGTTLQFKSLREAAPALQQLAKVPGNRAKLEQLAALSDVYKEAVQAGKDAPLSPALSEYAAGAKSIVLHAAVNDTMGRKADTLVRVSPSFEEFNRSVTNVSRALNEKRVLTEPEIALSQAVRELKANKLERVMMGRLPADARSVPRQLDAKK